MKPTLYILAYFLTIFLTVCAATMLFSCASKRPKGEAATIIRVNPSMDIDSVFKVAPDNSLLILDSGKYEIERNDVFYPIIEHSEIPTPETVRRVVDSLASESALTYTPNIAPPGGNRFTLLDSIEFDCEDSAQTATVSGTIVASDIGIPSIQSPYPGDFFRQGQYYYFVTHDGKLLKLVDADSIPKCPTLQELLNEDINRYCK